MEGLLSMGPTPLVSSFRCNSGYSLTHSLTKESHQKKASLNLSFPLFLYLTKRSLARHCLIVLDDWHIAISLNWPTGPIQCFSCNVILCVCVSVQLFFYSF